MMRNFYFKSLIRNKNEKYKRKDNRGMMSRLILRDQRTMHTEETFINRPKKIFQDEKNSNQNDIPMDTRNLYPKEELFRSQIFNFKYFGFIYPSSNY